MMTLLYDPVANLYFCQPLVKSGAPDANDAHQFVTLERAEGGVVVWRELHNIELQVVPVITPAQIMHKRDYEVVIEGIGKSNLHERFVATSAGSPSSPPTTNMAAGSRLFR